MNGSNSVLRKNSSLLTGNITYTIAFSFKVRSTSSSRKEIFSLMRDTNGYRGPLLSSRGTAIHLDYNGYAGGTYNITIEEGRRYRGVFLHTSSRVNTLYIDGVNVGTITMSYDSTLYGNQMHLGSENDGQSVFYGNLRNFIFEDVIRDSETIQKDYHYFPNE